MSKKNIVIISLAIIICLSIVGIMYENNVFSKYQEVYVPTKNSHYIGYYVKLPKDVNERDVNTLKVVLGNNLRLMYFIKQGNYENENELNEIFRVLGRDISGDDIINIDNLEMNELINKNLSTQFDLMKVYIGISKKSSSDIYMEISQNNILFEEYYTDNLKKDLSVTYEDIERFIDYYAENR